MRFKFFTIPIHDAAEAEAELNQFLAGHRVVSVDRQFAGGPTASWALCVTYLSGSDRSAPPKGGKIDYREVLPEEQFKAFAKLRSLRKAIAEEEGVPAYALFTNEQLATMVKDRAHSAEDLMRIPGVGESRIRKYGQRFLALLAEQGELRPEPRTGAEE